MTAKSITFRNYRCFGPQGATLPLDKDFIGVVGVNNAGKSTLLKAFFELRPILSTLGATGAGNELIYKSLSHAEGYAMNALALGDGERIFPVADRGATPRITIAFERDASSDPEHIKGLTIVLGHRWACVNKRVCQFPNAEEAPILG